MVLEISVDLFLAVLTIAVVSAGTAFLVMAFRIWLSPGGSYEQNQLAANLARRYEKGEIGREDLEPFIEDGTIQTGLVYNTDGGPVKLRPTARLTRFAVRAVTERPEYPDDP